MQAADGHEWGGDDLVARLLVGIGQSDGAARRPPQAAQPLQVGEIKHKPHVWSRANQGRTVAATVVISTKTEHHNTIGGVSGRWPAGVGLAPTQAAYSLKMTST